jgi:hypothetical protein
MYGITNLCRRNSNVYTPLYSLFKLIGMTDSPATITLCYLNTDSGYLLVGGTCRHCKVI